MKVLLILSILFLAHSAYSQEEDATSGRIEEINRIVEEKSAELSAARAKQKETQAAYNKIKQEVRGIQAKEATLRRELEAFQTENLELEKEIELAEDQVESIERRYRARLRALYMYNPHNLTENLFVVSDRESLRRNAYFMERIRRYDNDTVNTLYSIKAEKAEKLEEIQRLAEQKAATQSKISEQSKLLSKKLKEQGDLLEQFNREKAKLENSIASLKAQALRIETVLTSLTGKFGRGSEAPKRGLPAKEPFQGEGLESLKGRLPFPVVGSISKAGADDSFAEMVGKKGITFRTSPGADIAAVAPGRVIYTGPMPGLGEIIILDHGSRSYSLYGKLAISKIKLQQDVQAGEVIAIALDQESARNGAVDFYFEIRKNGIPVDANGFFSKSNRS